MTVQFQIPNLDYLRAKDPKQAEMFDAVARAITTIAQQTASVPQGNPVTPSTPTAINVVAAGGIVDIAILDNNPHNIQIAPDYFVEYSASPSFIQPITIHLGPVRNHRVNLGNQTFYWRAYAQNGRASQPSPPVYFGSVNNPTAVSGGGAISGPSPLPSSGSGTAPTTGLQGGAGYGKLTPRAQQPPELP